MSTPQSSLARRTAVVAGAGLAVLGGTIAPAAADVPTGWSQPDDMSWLALLGIIAGVPIVLAVIITVIVLLPSLLRGEGLPKGSEVEWVGGPRQGTSTLSESGTGETGGASARF